ncbi:hypothetical protein BB381_07740, partial [Campylobacter pinnipediorum subsp. caledonicus]|uniref:hypothetical protein n=1 Tax=Campylobacter pinnipediorum TaxID=1965231 RepID=UPI0009D42460
MKISKIVSAAILSVAVSSVAFGADGGGVATNPALDFFKIAKDELNNIAKNKAGLADDLSVINDDTVKGAFQKILVKAKELTIPQEGFNIENFATVGDKQVGLKLTKQASKPMLEISYDGKKDVLSLGNNDDLTFEPRVLDKIDSSLKHFKNQEVIKHDDGIETDIANNTKNKTMFDYVKLIGSGTSEVFDYLIKNNENLGNNINTETQDAITQNAHPHLQKIAQILDAAKKAKEAKNNNVDFTDIAIGDKFKISIDTTDKNKPKLKIKDTHGIIHGEDVFTLEDTTLKYEKNTVENVWNHMLLNFKADGADKKVAEALGDNGAIGQQKKEADKTKAKALLREAINTVLENNIDALKTYDSVQDPTTKENIKKILTLVKDSSFDFLTQGINADLELTQGKAKIKLKKTDDGAELDIIYDHDEDATLTETANNTSKFILNNDSIEYTSAQEQQDKLTELAKIDGIKTKIEDAFNKGTHLNLDKGKIAKAKAKADLYQTLVTNLPQLLTAEKIDNIIKAGTTGIENEKLKAIVDKVKEAGEELTANLGNINNKNITLTLKSDGTKIEIEADGKKDTITLLADNKFKVETNSKVAKPVLQELAEIKNTLGENPFNAAIEEAKKKIVKEGDHVLTSTEIDKRKEFLDAVYTDEQNNALKTILDAIKTKDLTTANTDADILSKIGEAGKDKIKTMLEKAKEAGNDYITSLALTATIGGATVKLEILEGNKPALTIEKDGKKDTFKLSGDNNGQLEYTSAKTSTKDSVLHLLSNFDPTNLNATLSVFIAKNGGEITAKEITAGNIDRIEDTADDKERDLKVAQATLAAINAGEKATEEKVKTLETKVAAANKAKEAAEAAAQKAKETADQANATQEQKAAAQKAAEAEAEAELAAEEAKAELEIAKEAQTAAKAEDVTTPEKIAKAKEKITKDIQAKSKQVDVLNDALAETNVNTVKAVNELKEKEKTLKAKETEYKNAAEAQKAEKLKALNDAKKEVAEAKEEVGEANADRAKRATRKLDNTNKSIAESLG